MSHESATITVLQSDVREMRDEIRQMQADLALLTHGVATLGHEHEARLDALGDHDEIGTLRADLHRLSEDAMERVTAIDVRVEEIEAARSAIAAAEPAVTSPLIALDGGPTRVSMLDGSDSDALTEATNQRLADIEATGSTVMDIRFAHATHGDYQEGGNPTPSASSTGCRERWRTTPMTSSAPLRPGQAQAARSAIRHGTVPLSEPPETCTLTTAEIRRVALLRYPAATQPRPDEERWNRRTTR